MRFCYCICNIGKMLNVAPQTLRNPVLFRPDSIKLQLVLVICKQTLVFTRNVVNCEPQNMLN